MSINIKDTIAAYEDNNEIYGGQHPWSTDTTVSINSVIHHYIPIFTSQDLEQEFYFFLYSLATLSTLP